MKKYLALLVCILLFFPACGKDSANTASKNEEQQKPGKKITSVASPYWVENGVRMVSGDDVILEDPEGVCRPILSGDGKSIIYSNGTDKLLLYTLSNGKKQVIYQLKGDKSVDYKVYPVGWSADGKRVTLETSHSGGFIGGNELIILSISDSKASVVVKTLDSADWGKDGQLVIADSSEVKIIDENGRVKKKLKTPQMKAFFSASNPSFSPDGKFIVYNCGESYYLHDIEKDEYKKIFNVRAYNGPARINKDGRIIVDDKGDLYVYNPSDNTYKVFYDKAKSSYPNW